ncbi:TPA: hypothetical protein RFG09_001661 [Klebsiella aerogenes]|nr:hypothetical protein [Klebsiella aerogenes]
MTDITRLLASLKRRSAHAKEFGDDITFVKLEDLDALIEALEKAQQMETYWKTQCRGITDHCEKLQAQITAASEQEEDSRNIALRQSEIIDLQDKRIAELESRTVTVKLPAAISFGENGYRTQVIRLLTDAGIKWEAE